MNLKKKHYHNWIAYIFLLPCIFAAAWFYESIISNSALHWTFQQTHYWNSLFEIVVLCMLLCLFIYIPSNRLLKYAFVTITLLLFSYLHAFFYAFIVGILYLIMLYLTGKFVFRFFLKETAEFLECIMLGMAGLIILVAVCSLLRIGTPPKLRVVYLSVFFLELYVFRDELYKQISEFILNCRISSKPKITFSTALTLAVLLSAFMIQVGRANIAIDYDSGWYGLRSGSVLAPYTGIYDQLMLTGCVYVYSKGIEALSLAFSFDTTYSYVYAVNLMFAALTLVVVYKTVALFIKKEHAYYVAMCCSVTAGIMNMASTAKSDIPTLFLQLSAFYFGMKTLKDWHGRYYITTLAAVILSLVFKPSSVVFSILLIIIISLFTIKKARISSSDWGMLLLPAFAVILLTARTYVLTGLPLTSFGRSLWNNLGMEYEYPYNMTSYSSMLSISDFFQLPTFCERAMRVIYFLFSPINSEMDHVIIAWPGVLFSVIWITIVIHVFSHPSRTFKRMKGDRIYAFSVTTLAIISVVSMGCMVLLEKPDGNYFMLMYALTFIHASLEFSFLSEEIWPAIRCAMIPLVVCGVIMCVASHWSWALGFTPIDLENNGAYNHKQVNEEYYKNIQIDGIADFLEKQTTPARIMVFSTDIPKMLFIDAIAETWIDLARWGNDSLVRSPEELYSYFCVSDMKYLLVNMDYANSDALISSNLQILADNGHLSLEMMQGNHCLLRFVPDTVSKSIS